MASRGDGVALRVLGSLEVVVDGRVVTLGSPKLRAVLAALVIEANSVVSADRLAEILWHDEPPATVESTLQKYVYRLRTVLEPDRGTAEGPSVLVTRAPGYLLRVEASQYDAARFEQLVSEAQVRAHDGDPAAALAILDAALALWRGPAFAEFAFDDFARPEAARLEERRLVAFEDRAEASLALGRHGELIGELEGTVAASPLRERLRAQLMLALYRTGRHVEALRVYQDCRRYLGDELGLEPSGALRDLEEAMVLQKPELDFERGPLPAVMRVPGPTTSSSVEPARAGDAAIRPVEADDVAHRVDEAVARAAATRLDLELLEDELAGDVLALRRLRDQPPDAAGGDKTEGRGPPGPMDAPAPALCPYKGLACFEAADAANFFGRERLVAELVARLAVERFVGIVGASGSGKSSLLRAGLLPALAAGALPGSEDWLTVLVTPGTDPPERLANALAGVSSGSSPDAVRAHPRDVPDAIEHAAREALGASPAGRLVVVVDQLEELFTVCRDDEQRSRFVAALVGSIADPTARVSVILAVRADYYERCAAYPELVVLLEASHVLVGPLSDRELRRVIAEPAGRARLDLEDGLIDAIAGDVGHEPGALPLLSTALLETWVRRHGSMLTLAGYLEAGGVHGALARLADSVVDRFDTNGQVAARRILLRLAEPGEDGDDVRRQVPRAQLLAPADTKTAAVLATLVEHRMLTAGADTVEVAHEALLREWPRVRAWLDEDREGRRLERDLDHAARQWDAAGRDPSGFYRGARLGAALDWSANHPDDGNPLEREFLDASEAGHGVEVRNARRTARRLRSLAVGLAVLLVVALVAGTVAVIQRHDADSQAARASRNATLAEATRLGTLADTLPTSQLDLGLLLGVEGRRILPSNATDGGLEAALARTPLGLEQILHFATTSTNPSVTPDGRLLAAPGTDGKVRLYDLPRGRLVRTLAGHSPNGAFVAQFSPDESRLAAGGSDGKVLIWQVATGKPIGSPIVPGGTQVYGLFDPTDPARLFTVSNDGTVARWDLHDPAHPHSIGDRFSFPVASASDTAVGGVSADGRFLAAGGFVAQRTVLWDVASHRLVADLLPGAPGLFSPDSATLTTTLADRVLVWDAASGQQHGDPLTGFTLAAPATVFSPDGHLLAVGDLVDNTIRVFDVASRQPIGAPLALHGTYAFPSRFLADGRLVTTGATEAAIWRLGARVAPPVTVLGGRTEWLLGQFTPDGSQVVTVELDRGTLAWDAATGTSSGELLDGRIVTHFPVAFSPDGKTIAASGLDRTFTLWDRASGRPLARIDPNQPGDVGTSLAWDPHRPILATTGADASVVLWNVTDPQHPVEQRRLTRQTEPSSAVQAGTGDVPFSYFSPDVRLLATASASTATIINVATGHTVRVLDDGGATTLRLSFTPDGTTLAAAVSETTTTGTVVLWDLATGQRRATPPLPYRPNGIAFFAGGTRFATAGPAGQLVGTHPSIPAASGIPGTTTGPMATTARIDLWDTATLQSIGEPISLPASATVFTLANPHGTKLVVGTNGSAAILADVDPHAWEHSACRIAGRNLTRAEWAQYLPGRPYHTTCPHWPAER